MGFNVPINKESHPSMNNPRPIQDNSALVTKTLRVKPPRNRQHFIGGTIINHDDFLSLPRLANCGLQHMSDSIRGVERRDEDRYKRFHNRALS